MAEASHGARRLLVVGAGGLGRIVYDVLRQDPAFLREQGLALGGFLDTRAGLALPPEIGHPVIGDPETYRLQPNDVLIPAVGVPAWREKLLAPLIAQQAAFVTYARQASIAARCTLGEGCFLTPGAVVSVDCRIGAFAYLDTYCVIGHDVHIGRSATVGAMTFIAGGVRIGDGVAIHPRVTIAKGVSVGDGATIGIGSVVVKDVAAGTTVFGNPARPIF